MGKKILLTEVFEKISKRFSNNNQLVNFTEAVLITNPTPYQIRRGLYKLVSPSKFNGIKISRLLRDTFGEIMNGKKALTEEKLMRHFWN